MWLSLNWLLNPKNLFRGLKLLSLRGSRWFPRYGWRGHSAVSCCFQVSSGYWLHILKTCTMTCFGKTWVYLLLLAGLLEAKSLLNIMKQEGTDKLQIWNISANWRAVIKQWSSSSSSSWHVDRDDARRWCEHWVRESKRLPEPLQAQA